MKTKITTSDRNIIIDILVEFNTVHTNLVEAIEQTENAEGDLIDLDVLTRESEIILRSDFKRLKDLLHESAILSDKMDKFIRAKAKNDNDCDKTA